MSDSFAHTLRLEVPLREWELQALIATAPKRYRIYEIPKRNGKMRTIAHPARELKLVQRIAVSWLEARLPVSKYAAAYVSGKSIRDNAVAHVGNGPLLKLDFESFFPSIRPVDLVSLLRRNSVEISPESVRELINITFWGEGGGEARSLAIGAPSSPMISNMVMYEVDEIVGAYIESLGGAYTRYADDITVSGAPASILKKIELKIHEVVSHVDFPRLRFNDSKRRLVVPRHRRMVTGLIITPDGKVSIGRDRKRAISSSIHRYIKGELDPDAVSKLSGYLAFANAVEPTFVESMRRKYGERTIARLFGPDRQKRPV